MLRILATLPVSINLYHRVEGKEGNSVFNVSRFISRPVQNTATSKALLVLPAMLAVRSI